MAEDLNYSIDSGQPNGPAGLPAPDLPYKPRGPVGEPPVIGLIGAGGITDAHLDAYKKAGFEVAVVCDVDQGRAEMRRDKFFPEARAVSDMAEVLGDPRVGVIDAATHPAERGPIIEAALNAGKHVLSQKPFVLDLDEGERLAALAKEKGLRLAVNQNGRWAPHVSWMRQAVSAGLIGEVVGVHMGVSWNHAWIKGTPFENVHHVVLYDFAIHWFDMLSCFMGSRTAARVFASTAHAAGQPVKPPLLGQALVEYEGAQATLSFDAYTPVGSRDFTLIAGSKGILRSEGPDLGNQTVTLQTEAGACSPVLEGSWFNDGFHGTMAELMLAIEEGREPANSAANNLRGLAVCFAALKSADSGLPQVPGQARRLA